MKITLSKNSVKADVIKAEEAKGNVLVEEQTHIDGHHLIFITREEAEARDKVSDAQRVEALIRAKMRTLAIAELIKEEKLIEIDGTIALKEK